MGTVKVFRVTVLDERQMSLETLLVFDKSWPPSGGHALHSHVERYFLIV